MSVQPVKSHTLLVGTLSISTELHKPRNKKLNRTNICNISLTEETSQTHRKTKETRRPKRSASPAPGAERLGVDGRCQPPSLRGHLRGERMRETGGRLFGQRWLVLLVLGCVCVSILNIV